MKDKEEYISYFINTIHPAKLSDDFRFHEETGN